MRSTGSCGSAVSILGNLVPHLVLYQTDPVTTASIGSARFANNWANTGYFVRSHFGKTGQDSRFKTLNLGLIFTVTRRGAKLPMQRSRKPRAFTLHCIPPLSVIRQKCASDPRMQAALDFLLAHELKRKFCTEALSDHLNLSPSRVQHLFQQHLGMSPTQVFKLRQMETAKERLDSTFLRVKEVMAAVGRHDLSHFVRDFKQLFGYTPAQRRKRALSPSTHHHGATAGTNGHAA